MEDSPTKDEVERRAQEVARRLMSKPYTTQKWPGKRSPTEPAARDGASTPRMPNPSAEAS